MTDRRIAHYQKLLQEHIVALQAVHATSGARLQAYKQKLVKDGCPHPDTHSYVVDCDDGYGRWWKNRIHECTVCRTVTQVEYNYKESTDAASNTPR